jgi:hypothetical protein
MRPVAGGANTPMAEAARAAMRKAPQSVPDTDLKRYLGFLDDPRAAAAKRAVTEAWQGVMPDPEELRLLDDLGVATDIKTGTAIHPFTGEVVHASDLMDAIEGAAPQGVPHEDIGRRGMAALKEKLRPGWGKAQHEALHRIVGEDPVAALKAAQAPFRSGVAIPRSLLSRTMDLAPKALATGVAAKLMLGGAAKAAGLPGVGEAAEMAGREDPSLQQFFREQEEGITGALGLPQRSQMPVYSMDPAREGAARVMLRTGRENLRPGFDQPAITKQELEYVKKKAAPRHGGK